MADGHPACHRGAVAEERWWLAPHRTSASATPHLDACSTACRHALGAGPSQAVPVCWGGEGATVAAWKQAARGERAHLWKTSYGQGLLDLVKAFERIQHRHLVKQALKLRYPMWMVRLSIATYRIKRVMRVGSAASDCVVATRGITAGSGTATTEMRLAMIDSVDQALDGFPAIDPTLYVDDLSAEVAGQDDFIKANLVGFLKSVCVGIKAAGGEVSATKIGLLGIQTELNRGNRHGAPRAWYPAGHPHQVPRGGIGCRSATQFDGRQQSPEGVQEEAA